MSALHTKVVKWGRAYRCMGLDVLSAPVTHKTRLNSHVSHTYIRYFISTPAIAATQPLWNFPKWLFSPSFR